MFPCHHEIVDAVPEADRYPTLEEYEATVDGLAEPLRDRRVDAPAAEALAKVRARAAQLAAEAAVQPVPIRRLAQTQLAGLLCALDAVRARHRPARPRPDRSFSHPSS